MTIRELAALAADPKTPQSTRDAIVRQLHTPAAKRAFANKPIATLASVFPNGPIARCEPDPPIVGIAIHLHGLKLVNPLNHRRHWRTVSERGRREKQMVTLELLARGRPSIRPPCTVTLTRVFAGHCRELDSDGWVAACKHCRDAVAKWLGTDDGPRGGIKWEYAQERGAQNGVVISIERAG